MPRVLHMAFHYHPVTERSSRPISDSHLPRFEADTFITVRTVVPDNSLSGKLTVCHR